MTSHFYRVLKNRATGPISFPSNVRLLQKDLDSLINAGESFTLTKHDITTVGVLDGHVFGLEQDLLIKRFNDRGIIDYIARRLLKSRARRLWDITQRLSDKGLPVPRPLGFLEPSLLRRNSFFISSFIENSSNLADVYKQGLFKDPRSIAAVLGKTLSAWHMAGAVHGDLKWSNILMQNTIDGISFFLVDLDNARLYPKPRIRGITRDLVRFYRYGLELGAEEWVRSEFLPSYLGMLDRDVGNRIDVMRIRVKARKDWERKRQGLP